MDEQLIYFDINGQVMTTVGDLAYWTKNNLPRGLYLYGADLKVLADMGYKEALLYKIELSKALVTRLLKAPPAFVNLSRISDSLNAQKFNQELLDELDGR